MTIMRRAIISGVLFLELSAMQAQTKPDIAAVLKKVSQLYGAATQFELIGEVTCRAATGDPVHITFAFKPPNKYRIQSNTPCVKPGEPTDGETLRINDGSSLWEYYKLTNEYVSIPAQVFSGRQPDFIGKQTMARYRDIVNIADQVKFVREEAVSYGASKVDCYVVAIPKQEYVAAQTWWIDKVAYHVIRIDNDESSTLYTTIKLNEPLPDTLFKFTPPPGAKNGGPAQ